MKKKILCLLGFLILFSQSCSFVSAKSSAVNSRVKVAIKKYKAGNYTGCLQDCQDIVSYCPNGLAYYYMALAYTRAGKKDEAIKNYAKVLSMSKTPKLRDYAAQGKKCLETPDQCHPAIQPSRVTEDDLDKFINANSMNLSDSVRKDYQQKRLNNIKNDMNKDKELDDYNFKDFKDYSNQHSYNESDNRLAQAYTDEDIQNALKVLNESGYNNVPQTQNLSPELAQIQAMLGTDNSNGVKTNNSMADMLPYMLSQQKNGSANYSPQALQAIIMNSTTMNEFNYNLQDANK